jgi:hypothetical protein
LKIFARTLIFSIVCLALSQFLTRETYAQDKDFKQMRSEHFIINYQEGVKRGYVSKIKNTAERFYRTITQEFSLIRDELWLWENRAKVFIAKDKDSYLEKFGCSSWSAACVNYHEKIIYTYPDQSRFSSIFIHELTHIIFRERSGKGNFPLWLDEGAATFVEDKYSGHLYKKRLKVLSKAIKNNKHIDFISLSKVTVGSLRNKDSEYVNLFYLESFSIVNFIIAKFGKYKFSSFLSSLKKGYSLESALAKISYQFKGIEDLEKQWKKFYQK